MPSQPWLSYWICLFSLVNGYSVASLKELRIKRVFVCILAGLRNLSVGVTYLYLMTNLI